jgi:hypothetical protein
MLTPKGKLVGIYRTDPKQAFEKLSRGYALVSWKDAEDLYIGCVVFDEGKPILADLEFVRSKIVLKGREALERILNVEYATVELYELEKDRVVYAVSINRDSKIEVEEKVTEKPKEERKELKVAFTTESNLEEFLSTVGDFTGLIVAKGEDREAKIYLKNGIIVGAEARIDGEKYKGKSALFYLDFHGKIICYEVDDVDNLIGGDVKIEEKLLVDREEILRKYRIKLPSDEEIRNLIKFVKDELSVESGAVVSLRIYLKGVRRKFVRVYYGVNPKKFFGKLRWGYLHVLWEDEDSYVGCVVFEDGKPVLADLEFVKSKKVLRGKDALEKISNVGKATVELYELEKDVVLKAISENPDAKVEAGEDERGVKLTFKDFLKRFRWK